MKRIAVFCGRFSNTIKRIFINFIKTKMCGVTWGATVDPEKFDNGFSRMLSGSSSTHLTIRLKENNAFLGIVVIDKHHDGNEREVSYQLLPNYWGQGFARETVGAVIYYAKTSLTLPSIVAETQVANLSSRKLLESLGMKPLKILKRFDADQIIYKLSFGH